MLILSADLHGKNVNQIFAVYTRYNNMTRMWPRFIIARKHKVHKKKKEEHVCDEIFSPLFNDFLHNVENSGYKRGKSKCFYKNRRATKMYCYTHV